MQVELVIAIFGSIILIGYLGELISKKFNISSVLLLLAVGLVLRLSGYADLAVLTSFQSIFGTLALIVILFDGGLSMNLQSLSKGGRILFLGAFITIVSIVVCALFFQYVFGVDPLIGAIFGAIAGGIGSTTTVSIVKSLSLPKEVGNFLTLESSITDVFSIILTIVLTQALIGGTLDLSFIFQNVLSRFSNGLLLGVVFGLLTLKFLSFVKKGYIYIVTFAILLLLYSTTDYFGGSSAVAILAFGIIFGNDSSIREVLKFKVGEGSFIIKDMHAEISFFIRTFFLVFLGIVVTLGSLSTFIQTSALMVLLYLIRFASIKITTFKSDMSQFNGILTAINPRGLATAVLATYPLAEVAKILPNNPSLSGINNQLGILPQICFYIILISLVVTSILIPLFYKKPSKVDASEADESVDFS